MSNNPPNEFGTPDDPNPSQWEEIMKSLFGSQADEAIAQMKAQGIDPSALGEGGFPANPAMLGPMMDQVRQMFENSGGSSVNAGLARDLARQTSMQGGDPTIMAGQERHIVQALSIAELWLDAATDFAPSPVKARAMSRAQWVESTLPAWQALAEPVAESVAAALTKILKDSLPEGFGENDSDSIGIQISGMPGIQGLPSELSGILGAGQFDPDSLMKKIGAAVFGMQIGTAAGTLSREVYGTTDIGVPLEEHVGSALLPTNIEAFAQDLDVSLEDVRQFLALREAAHTRLFTNVPWLRSHVYGLIGTYAHGITIDMEALEGSIREIDPTNAEALQGALSSGVFALESTPAQKNALARLETALALIEGWVEEIVARAAIAYLPSAIPLREMMRRRRAAGGPAEQTFSSLVGLELRPRRSRDAATLWATIEAERGASGRDAVWEHPDLLPTEADLDDPSGYFTRQSEQTPEMSDLDAALALIFEEADAASNVPVEETETGEENEDPQGESKA